MTGAGKYWRDHEALSVNRPARIVINGHKFIEHQVSVNERKECYIWSKKMPVLRYAYWGQEILTEPQIRERLSVMQKAG